MADGAATDKESAARQGDNPGNGLTDRRQDQPDVGQRYQAVEAAKLIGQTERS